MKRFIQSIWGNACLFQFAWFSAVLSAAHQQGVWGGLIVWGCVLIHLFNLPKERQRNELLLVGRCFLLGLLLETLFMHAQLMIYPKTGMMDWICPLWLASLWAVFAITLNHSLAWLKNHTIWAAILGALLGPLSYWAGARLGAGVMPDPILSMGIISMTWFIALPLMMRWSQRKIESSLFIF